MNDMEARTSRARIMTVAAIILLLAFVAVLFLSERIKHDAYEVMYTVSEATDHDADTILILGAGVTESGQPSAILKERLDAAVALYENGAAPKILITAAGPSAARDETVVMERYLLNAGIPNGVMETDPEGFSTSASMRNAAELFGVKRPIIVTQSYHLPRSIMLARHKGMDPIGAMAEQRIYPEQVWWDAREIGARIKDWVLIRFDLI